MRLTVLGVGRLKDGPERDLTDDYLRRAGALARPLGFRTVGEDEVPSGGGLDQEASRLLARLPAGANAWRLDEGGRSLPSAAFAERLARLRDDGCADLVMMIGGAEGFGTSAISAVPEAIAFGPQTWPHRLVRAMLAEQVYRAFTILAGTPYHKA